MTVGNFNKIKKDIESGLTTVKRLEGVVVGKTITYFINETKFVRAHFSEKQIAYLDANSTKIYHVTQGRI